MVDIWRQEADRLDSIAGEEAPRIIYGFTPINRPTLGSPSMKGPPPADNMAGLCSTPPKSRKPKLPLRTPVRRQVEGASQLRTPPPTIASPPPKRLKRKGFETTTNSTQGWTKLSKQAQPEPAVANLDEARDFGLTDLSGNVSSYDVPDEHCQYTPAGTVVLENPFVSSAGSGSSDTVNGTKLFTGRWWARSDIGSGVMECRSSIRPSGVQGQDIASIKDSASNPAPLRPSENCVASDSDNGRLDCIEIGEDVEQTIHQNLLTPGAGDAMDSFDGTASFHRYSHAAHFVHTSDEPGDEFLLDDNDVDDLIELSGGQAIVEPSSSLHLSPSQRLQVDDKSFPVRMQGLKAASPGKDIFILKNGVYAPVETTTTMGALNSDLDTGQFLGHARANIGKKLMAINTPETKLGISNDEEFFELDEEDETELVDLTAAISQDRGATLGHTATAPPTPPEATPARPCAPETARSTFTLPIPSSSPQPGPHSNSDRGLEPFVRPPFPKRVRDRSPIVDISSSGILRTCFRIGEALNAASVAFRTGTDVIIELFARVLSSTREIAGYKQHIDFADLFHSERPPFLSGTYELWKDGGRWEEDSRRLLDEDGRGKMCRAVGRLKRDPDTKVWKMAVLNIWEATWDDVAWVKGVVCA